MWFKRKNDVYEIDYDKDVAPIDLPPPDKTMKEMVDEVFEKLDSIEKKIDIILNKSPK